MAEFNLTSPGQVKSWCIENGFHPNKVLGQNFLIDRNTVEAIARTGLEGVARADGHPPRILEVGPGLGVLTETLLAHGASVFAVEKDPALAVRLAASLGSPAALEVVEGDALAMCKDSFGGREFDAMASNLPYQSGTRILLELAMSAKIPRMTVLVQTEVAERLAAPEGSRTRSLAGVLAQLDYDVKIVRKVSAACFWPRPAVGSAVAVLVRHGRNAALPPDVRAAYRSVAKRAFAQRRKQLGSVLGDMVKLKRQARAEELSVEDWITIAKGSQE